MNGKVCAECLEGFEPNRSSQRFCTARCANRQRDRRRRHGAPEATVPPANNKGPETECASKLTAHQPAASQEHRAPTKIYLQRIDTLQTALQSQSSELERLEAENTEQHDRIRLLEGELARLKRAQRTNIQDLAHVAARLVAVSNAQRVALDRATLDILRRRGWKPARQQSTTPRP